MDRIFVCHRTIQPQYTLVHSLSHTHTYATIRKIESYKCTIEISRHKNILTHTHKHTKQGTIVSVRHIEAAIRMRIITHSVVVIVIVIVRFECFVKHAHIHFLCSGLFFLFLLLFWLIFDDCVGADQIPSCNFHPQQKC